MSTPQHVPAGQPLPGGYRAIDMRLLPWTYSPLRRAWTWVWWKCIPFRWLTRLVRRPHANPYRKVVALVTPMPVPKQIVLREDAVDEIVRGGDHDLPTTDDQIAASPLFRRAPAPEKDP